jgi:hypothetical protein
VFVLCEAICLMTLTGSISEQCARALARRMLQSSSSHEWKCLLSEIQHGGDEAIKWFYDECDVGAIVERANTAEWWHCICMLWRHAPEEVAQALIDRIMMRFATMANNDISDLADCSELDLLYALWKETRAKEA